MDELGTISNVISVSQVWGVTVTLLLLALLWSIRQLMARTPLRKLETLVDELTTLTRVYLPRDADGDPVTIRLADRIVHATDKHDALHDEHRKIMDIVHGCQAVHKNTETKQLQTITDHLDNIASKIEDANRLLEKQGDELEHHRAELRETLMTVHSYMIELSKSLVEALQHDYRVNG